MTQDQGKGMGKRKQNSSVLLLWAGNIVLGVLLSLSFLGRVSPASSASVALFGFLGLVSSVGVLSVLPGFLSILVNRFLIGPKRNWLLAGIWTLAIWVLFVDTRLHGFYGFHINSTVMGALFTPGIDDSVSISLADILPLVLLAAILLPAQAWFASKPSGASEARWAGTVILGSTLSFLLLQFWEASIEVEYRDLIAERMDAAPVPLRKEPLSEFFVLLDDRKLAPLPAPSLPEKETHPNLLFLVLDCLRADAINEENAPFLSSFRSKSRDFQNHFSGGNWTQHGIFSMLYGLHASYWDPVLEAKESPPLIRSLQKANYDFRVYAAAAQTFPAFRSTCWVDIPDSVFDDFPGRTPASRDTEGAAAFQDWLNQRDSENPFFAFFLLDATHQAYSFPNEAALFHPYEEEIRYIPISYGTTEDKRIRIRNRYRNAVHYADSIVANIWDSLVQSGEADNTIIIVTGDHGEEFWEHGIWGHATNFSQEQVHVPLLVKGPGIPTGPESRPTSHIDLPRTVLEILGAPPEESPTWSLGENLFQPPQHRIRVTGGWQGLGIRVGETTLFLPTPEGGRGAAYNANWERIPDTLSVFQNSQATLGQVFQECERFLD